jgi:hypothetical protein
MVSIDDIRRVAELLRSEFGRVMAVLPADARATADAARFLNLNQQLCYRVHAGVRHRGDPATVVGVFPGVEGLRHFIAAAAAREFDRELLACATAAVDQFEALIRKGGGSQRRLVAIVESLIEPPTSTPAAMLKVRRAMFESYAALRGCRADAFTSVQILNWDPGAADRLVKVAAIAKIGVVRDAHSMPLVSRHRLNPEEVRTGAAVTDDAWSNTRIFTRFSSKPAPPVVARRNGQSVLVIFDPDRTRREPIDVVSGPFTAVGIAHPRASETGVLNTSFAVSTPSRWLVADFFVHRTLATLIPTAGVYSIGTEGIMAGRLGSRWYDLLPGTVDIKLLGRGLGQAECEQYTLQSELAGALFEVGGWSPDEFIGYRCQVEYPIGLAQYVVSFEDSSENPPTSGAGETP